jgi:hypothetical protein
MIPESASDHPVLSCEERSAAGAAGRSYEL